MAKTKTKKEETTPSETKKQKSARLPTDVTGVLEQLAKEFDLDESEIMKRLLRLSMRPVLKDKQVLFSPEASQPVS